MAAGYRLDLLAQVREAAGMSQQELARRTSVSFFAIQRLELNGVNGIATTPFTVRRPDADRLAAALGTDLEGLGASEPG